VLTVHLAEIGNKERFLSVDPVFGRLARGIHDSVPKMDVGVPSEERWEGCKYLLGLSLIHCQIRFFMNQRRVLRPVQARRIAKSRRTWERNGYLEIDGCCWREYIDLRHFCFTGENQGIYRVYTETTCFVEKGYVHALKFEF